MSNKIEVIVRTRPLIPIESLTNNKEANKLFIKEASHTAYEKDKKLAIFHDFLSKFGHFYPPESTNFEIFSKNLLPLLDKWLQTSQNVSIFTYGQTSTGKTFTMLGKKEKEKGILILSIEEILKRKTPEISFKCSYLEVYNEKIYDLLAEDKEKMVLKLKEDPLTKEFYVKGLGYKCLDSLEALELILAKGEGNRHYNATTLNHCSSRSHTVFRIAYGSNICIDFVDLAGSERLVKEKEGKLVPETKAINKSLFFLTQVISKLAGEPVSALEGGSQHIPYRNSPLTKILRASLTGKARSLLILCVHPCKSQLEHSLKTLSFGLKALKIEFPGMEQKIMKNIKNESFLMESNLKALNEKEKKIKELESLVRKLAEMVVFYQGKSEKALRRMNPENWQNVENDVLDLLREEKKAEAIFSLDIEEKILEKTHSDEEILSRIRFFNEEFYDEKLEDWTSTLESLVDFLE